MTVRREIHDKHGTFFITFTCYKWLSLFSETNSYDLVYNWFDVLIKKGNQIGGYVIMPNHVHALIALNQSPTSINKIVANGKRFIAYELIERLKQQGHLRTLEILKDGVSKIEEKKGQLHKVFEESFDVKICENYAFMEQKLDYMHNNPCSKKWTLAEHPIDYEHSSMQFYKSDDAHINAYVTSYTQLLEVV